MSFESLAILAVVALLLSKFIDAAIKPVWDKFGLDHFYLLYVALALGVPLGLATGVNAFPIFASWPLVGRGMSALIVGLGPSFIYDLVDKEPSPVRLSKFPTSIAGMPSVEDIAKSF